MQTFYIKTFGCQMNVYDGQRIVGMLRARGLAETDDIAAADLIILNTCAVREKASNKVFSELGRIRDRKKTDALFGIVGCVAKEEEANAFRRIPELNFVLGPQSYHKLPEILDNPDARLLNVDLSGLEKFDALFTPALAAGVGAGIAPGDGFRKSNQQNDSDALINEPTPRGAQESATATPAARAGVNPLAYIPIQEGCNHCCTYCIVPYTRGRELSRPFADVMRDVRAAADAGAIEICFLGQNVNGYKFAPSRLPPHRGPLATGCVAWGGHEGRDATEQIFTLADIIREIARIDSVKRIRFTSSYPTEMSDDLIALFGTEPKLLPFLNMPIQSGSPDVLTRMNRPYSLDLYLDIVNKLKAARPDIQISSDFIVGFPGETDAEFQQTLDIIRRVRYINSYSFKYSPRPHTAAATMPNQVPENVKRARLKILDDALTEINREFNESCVGRVLPCLIEGADKTGKHLLARTPYMQQAIVNCPPSWGGASPEATGGSSRSNTNSKDSPPSPASRPLPPKRGENLSLILITSANKCSLRGEIAD
ncbi:MAG: MiaB/RimO family radical SAM methylthiotransferase [Proteobacteria bacterium]|nr:MiaB/RimO family radical SAM methylthiotransferase [Pseudomonadota bacterium]